MKLIPLPLESIAVLGASHILRLTNDDLKAWTSATAQAIFPENAVGAATKTFGIGQQFKLVSARVVTVFTSSGGAITTLTFSLGDGGSATRFLNAIDLKTAAYSASANANFIYAAADTVDGVATIVGQTMASLNGGQLDLYLLTSDLSVLKDIKQP